MKVAAIGEAMIELSMVGDVPRIGVAGDTLNTAIYLKRTAPDLTVDYVTRLGGDAFSRRIEEFIAAQGIGTDAIERDADKTCGLYGITTDATGERTFTYWRSQSAARSVFSGPAGISFDWLGGYDVIYLSGISLAILPPETRDALLHWLTIYRTHGRRVVYDSNYRPALWPDQATARAVTRSMWHMCDIALPSQDDEAAIFDETLDAVATRFVGMGKTGALKRGPEGPLCLLTGQAHSYEAAAHVVDTTAAGDSFNGGYLGALLQGADQVTALRRGHDLAARVVGHHGAIIPVD
ncbi:MAG: sugar kinase [Pseudomonadota bacterium]